MINPNYALAFFDASPFDPLQTERVLMGEKSKDFS
jgi:hypothetical protein